jgi:pyridoxine 5-phosphate synthase
MNVHSHQQSTLLEVSLDPLLSFLDGCNDSSLDPLAFAITAEEAGADGLSIYLSAKNANVRQALMQTMSQQFTGRLKINATATAQTLDIVSEIRPANVCLVAADGGSDERFAPVDVVEDFSLLQSFVSQLHRSGHRSSLFVRPKPEQVQACAESGVNAIVLSAEHYVQADDDAMRQQALSELQAMAIESIRHGLSVQLSGNFNYQNIVALASLSDVTQINIGDAIFARTLSVGWNVAVKEMKAILVRSGLTQRA